MPEQTDTQALIDAAREGVEPIELHPGIWALRDEDGGLDVVNICGKIEAQQANPDRKTGHVTAADASSFAAYVARHRQDDTEIWGAADGKSVTAIINAHAEGNGPAGWRDHTATLTLTRSDDWDDWTLRDGKWLSQSDFAEFVEAHLPNFIDPRGADVLEMAQEFRARKSVRFDSSKRVKSGQTQITWHEDIDAKVGKGSIDIPDVLTLAMQVYERGETFGLTARLRYRINDGSLMLGFVLDRPRDVLMAAFDGIRQEISGMTGIDVWIGTPN